MIKQKKRSGLFYCLIAVGILLLSLDKVQAQALVPTPGGADMSGYDLDLWVDGNHSTNFSWAGLAPANYTLWQFSSNAPIIRNSRFNFNKELYYGNSTSSKLATSMNYNLVSGNSYYVFVVSDDAGVSNNPATLLTFYSSTNSSFQWQNGTSTSIRNNILIANWNTTTRNPGFNDTNPRYGISTMNIVNSSGGAFNMYLNGTLGTAFTLAASGASGPSTSNRPILIGNASTSTGTGSTAGFTGAMQEIILIRNTSNALMPDTTIAKIHSYLAIKYGITLNTGNYVNSDGTPVWTRNTSYNSSIFGIGRDNASGLNQVQSQSVESNIFTIYKATLGMLNDNESDQLTDKSFLMLGSNGATGYNTNYAYPVGSPFQNMNLGERISYRGNTVYKAQVTTDGVSGGAQTVNIKVNVPTDVKYVLVSPDAAFEPSNTYIYPVNGGIANNLSISDGEFITYAGFMSTPGGVDMSRYTMDLWVDGNNSTNSSWSNLAPSSYSLEKFSTNAPVVRNSRFNYQQELYFGNTTSSKLHTAQNFNLQSGDTYHIFVVSDGVGAGSGGTSVQALFTLSNSITYANLQWNLGTSTASRANILSASWNSTGRPSATADRFQYPNYPLYGIAALNIANTNNSPFQMYLNGDKRAENLGNTAATGSSTYNYPLLIGSTSTSAAGTANSFRGSIQEMIFIRKSASTVLMPDSDLYRIQTYLAVKYGITLNTDYVNSQGTTVWSRSVNSGYNNNIFGIGRDDKSGVYQKQSHSVTNSTMVAYVGDLKALNSQNTGEIGDLQYLMFGSNNQPPISGLDDSNVADGIEYSNGRMESTTGFNIQSAIYKTQLTGTSSMTLNLLSPSNDFTYLLVSSDEDFSPSQTLIYPINRRLIQNLNIIPDYPFLKFVGFSPGPGGVNPGLCLWLRADGDAEVGIDNLPATDSKLANYPYVIDPDNVPAVSTWRDLIRGQTYSYDQGAAEAAHRIPVMEYHSKEMNYYPAVCFWGSGNSYGSYLANTQGILPTPLPSSGGHTAIFMANNDFSSNDWIYMMMFGSATENVYSGPGYGVQKITSGVNIGNIVGRFRTSGTGARGTRNLFTPGATSILSYAQQTTSSSGSTNPIGFRFNGQEDNSTFSFGTFSLSSGSQLGKGYTYSRTIQGYMSEVIMYDRILQPEETQKVESYLAIKYGVTLYPSNTGTNRFNYEFSDGTPIWSGDTGSGIFADYYHNVAAVIRDDAARLYNSHSHSTNVGSLLHVGVAGTVLSDDGSGTGELNDMEAVAFGNDGATGNATIGDESTCGSFTERFNRKWLIHKITQDDRPVTLLIGAQNNAGLTIGRDSSTITDYYSRLNAGYDVSLIVADSPADIEAGNYKGVIPMTFINGEYQCSYTFTDKDTYITFGTKPNRKGCLGDEDIPFTGESEKTFYWNAWTSRTNRRSSSQSNYTIPVNPLTAPTFASYFDLGDSILVTGTSVTYPVNTGTTIGYPRSGSTPEKGSLQVRRRSTSNGEVIVNITFNHPVIPEFAITGLGSSGTYNYEVVDVSGDCSGSTYLPMLSYASDISKASYNIVGGTAIVKKRGNVSGSSANGRVNVKFLGGVTSVTIKYKATGVVRPSMQSIYITPVTLRPVPPPPPINEDQLSFVKQVKSHNITSCEPVEYSFFIGNYNCDSKVVHFSDTLPEHMKWQIDAIGLDGISAALNNSLSEYNPQISPDGRILQIDSLYVPGQTLSPDGLILTATAVIDGDALDKETPSMQFDNRAAITYHWTLNNKSLPQKLMSVDRQTGADYTSFIATLEQQQLMVEMTPSYSRKTYKENDEITVTYTLNNPNGDLTDMFLNVDFNEEFTYVPGSFQATSENPATPVPVLATTDDPSTLSIVGLTYSEDGFTLPAGQTTITFKLKAPAEANLVYEADEEGNPTEKVVDLDIVYAFSSDMDDPCAIMAIQGLQGDYLIPYSKGREHIITNRHITMEGE